MSNKTINLPSVNKIDLSKKIKISLTEKEQKTLILDLIKIITPKEIKKNKRSDHTIKKIVSQAIDIVDLLVNELGKKKNL